MLSFLPRGPRLSEPSTAELLAQLEAGETRALEPLYRRESGAVYRYALALSGNPAWAADAMQDAFLALVQRPKAVDPALGSLGAWLAGVARHSLSARWREARRELPGEPDPAGPEDLDTGTREGRANADDAAEDQPLTRLVRAQTAEEVWAALRRLPLAFAEAVVLVDLQERTYVEAAAIAGVPVNTLRTRLHRGRARLVEMLSPTVADGREPSPPPDAIRSS
jgi:RNA polymerase sigma-70 factor (ECF subfamily)